MNDQSRLVPRASAVEALAQLRVLIAQPREWDPRDADSAEARSARAYNSALAKVRAVLDAVPVYVPQRSELCRCGHPRTVHFKPGDPRGTCTRDASGVWPPVPCACPGYDPIDAVSVDATPAQGIDRDALKDLILWAMHAGLRTDVADVWVERFLALVRPVEGIIITPEEIEAVLVLFGYWDRGAIPAANVADRILALAARLEASS